MTRFLSVSNQRVRLFRIGRIVRIWSFRIIAPFKKIGRMGC